MSEATPTVAADAVRVIKRERRGWYFYDWANSAYTTTVGSVLFAPYLTSVAERAACGTATTACTTNLHVLGIPISPGSLAFYVVTASTIVSALLLPIVGAAADRTARKKDLMCGLAWIGALAACGLVFVAGTDWQLGVVLLFVANIALGSSLVVYDALLIEIAPPDERDAVSSRGWAFGYLGGFLLLAINLAMVLGHDALGMSLSTATRLSLLSAGLWWGGFSVIPYLRIRRREPTAVERVAGGRDGAVRGSFAQLGRTLRDIRQFPVTLLFLVAYLFFNDGIQTVIAVASTYGSKQLGFGTQLLIAVILAVQIVAFVGATLFGRVAARIGSLRTIQGGLLIWVLIVIVAFGLPAGRFAPFLALSVAIGLVLGGTQALTRSAFSQLVPNGRQAEYFSLYQAGERGTSWLGTLVFGLVHQLTGSYRPAIVALIAFFVIGFVLLLRVDMRRGIREAGNVQPARV